MNHAAHVGHSIQLPIGRLLKNPDKIGWVVTGITSAPQRRNARGCGHLEFAVRFISWAQALRYFPTPAQIQDEFEVSRATAWRYRAELADLFGIEAPRVYGEDGGH